MARQISGCITVFSLLLLCGLASGRFLYDKSELVSDGVGRRGFQSFLRFPEQAVCEETYGFLPCTSSALGNLFLILVYGYLMFLAATYLSNGSELLLEILGPGIVGGLFLPVLGAFPDAMLILVSGLSGSKETAQSQVSVGMGLLAGSTVMLLTVIWGSCVIVGKCDLNENTVAIDLKDTKGFSLTGSGVSTDTWTSYAGIIMAVSVIPFVIVQLPHILGINSAKNEFILISLIVSVSLLIAYCLYQICQPMVQRRRLEFAKQKKHVISGILTNLKMKSAGKLLSAEGEVQADVLRKLFDSIDENRDGHLSHAELKALIVGVQLSDVNLDENKALDTIMKEFDTSLDSRVDFQEFVAGIRKWLREATGANSPTDDGTMNHVDDFHAQAKKEGDLLGDQNDEVSDGVDDPKWTSAKAFLLVLLGTVIAAAFADPLVDAVDNFSSATSIPTFFISFIALPLATNSSEAVSAIIFASRKKLRSASLTFSELYGAVTMNNVLCLSVFLALVYVRGLVWDFSSEVLVILIVCIVMGIFASIHTTFPLWTSLLAFMLYPFSLAIVYILDYVFGWS